MGHAVSVTFATLGRQVKIGSRKPGSEKVKTMLPKIGHGATAGSFAEAASFAEVAVLATLWSGPESAVNLLGPVNLAGTVVIDATNPLVFTSNRPRPSCSAIPTPVGSGGSAGCRAPGS